MNLLKKNDVILKCNICPNKCNLKEEQIGKCKARKIIDGNIIDIYSGIITSSNIDPIEKKPLYHFYPGSRIFSIGFYGCTMTCKFCQNYSISQITSPLRNSEKKSPDEILQLLKQNDFDMVAATYSEPLLHFEWLLDFFRLCKNENIKTVLVTNGYINIENAKKLFPYIDAMNVDLKSSKNDFYNKICGGTISPVKEFIIEGHKEKIHIEITTLVITDTNDKIEECDEITDFIYSISEDIPFHISKYFPTYKMENPATSIKTIENWVSIAKKKLNYVYGGNIGTFSDTNCPKCSSILIKRDFYGINIKNLIKNNSVVECKNCGATLKGFVFI